MERSEGTLLGGRLSYAQPISGYYRTGIEPVLLAASIPARPGQRILEAGMGAGAALLCLMARVPGLQASGIELDPAMAELARDNLAANGMEAAVYTGDVAMAAGLGPMDHAFANPPWHDPAGTPSPDRNRALAKQRQPETLQTWIEALSAALDRDGTITLALPASLEHQALTHLTTRGLGEATVFPLWPRQGSPAKLILLQARHGTPNLRTAHGLVLHPVGQGYTEAAEAVLRHASPLDLNRSPDAAGSITADTQPPGSR